MIVQGALINEDICSRKEVVRNSIKANFTEVCQSNYEVLLEVSSNKFLVNVETNGNDIEGFEVIAVKGFMELSTKVIDLLKRTVIHLWDMRD